MPCGELANPLEHGQRIGHPQKCQVLIERLPVHGRFDSRHLQQGLHFGRKGQLSAALAVVERLDSKMIARQKQFRRRRAQIADGKCEHAIQPIQALHTVLFVKMNHCFRVGMRAKTVPLALEVAAQIGEVVNFAVVGNPDRAVFVAHRHVAVGRKIENGQPPAAQPNVPAIRETALPEPGIVGAAVRLHLRHAGEGLRVAPVRDSADAAHRLRLSRSATRKSSPWNGTSAQPESRSRSIPARRPENRSEENTGTGKAEPENPAADRASA